MRDSRKTIRYCISLLRQCSSTIQPNYCWLSSGRNKFCEKWEEPIKLGESIPGLKPTSSRGTCISGIEFLLYDNRSESNLLFYYVARWRSR